MRSRLVGGLTAACLATVAACTGQDLEMQGAQFLHQIDWPEPQHRSGGFSALEVSKTGRDMVVISDRGEALQITVSRRQQKITGIEITGRRRLEPETSETIDRDSEGLALLPGGALAVSFEFDHRVARYGPTGTASRLGGGTPFADLPPNGGLEALAVDPEGRLVTLPERMGRLNRDFPIWRLDGNWQQVGVLPRSAGFSPVGADFGPDGRLYVLERAFTGFGFRTRIRSLVLQDGVQDLRQNLVTPLGRFGNLEGLSVWQDDSGQIRFTMISDNNFARLLKTQIVEYRLPLPEPAQ